MDHTDSNGRTPLHIAAWRGDSEMAQLLLSAQGARARSLLQWMRARACVCEWVHGLVDRWVLWCVVWHCVCCGRVGRWAVGRWVLWCCKFLGNVNFLDSTTQGGGVKVWIIQARLGLWIRVIFGVVLQLG